MIPKQLQQPDFRFCLIRQQSKAPFEKEWQKKGHRFDDPKLLEHIRQGGNYGVIGGYGKLRILDKDKPELSIDLDTFCVQTGSGGKHYYFLSDYDTNHVFVNELGELRANNYQVVGAGCIHPNGNTYTILNDVPIKFISSQKLKEIIKPYLREEQTPSTTTKGRDTSRSGFEFRKAISLFKKGKNREQVEQELMVYKKFADAPEQYREMTLDKAEDFVLTKDNLTDNINNSSKIFTRLGQAEQFIEKQPIFYDKSKMWWFWDKKKYKWVLVDETDILNSIYSILDIDTINSKAKTEILESLKQVGRKQLPQPIKKTWIQFKDIIFDIQTGEEFKATPKYFVTNPLPWSLHKERFVNTPTIDKLLTEWVGEKYVQSLYEIIAYCTIPHYPLHRLFCLIGGGLNGKSCFLTLLRKFIGQENVCSTELDILLNSRFEVTRLHKKLMCQMGETNFNEMNKTSMLKKLTGGDLIGFEYKNKDPFQDTNYAKIIIATNNLPTTTDKTMGFYRRWFIIDFPNQFSEQRDVIAEIPDEEFECLAVKILGVLKDLLTEKKFTNEGDIETRMAKYEEKSDFFQTFLDEFVEFDAGEYITKRDFYKKLTSWCKERSNRMLAENTVGKKMKEKNIEGLRKNVPFYDGLIQVWDGIKWKT